MNSTMTKPAFITVLADVGYVAPPPAGARIEIFAAAPGGPRWDISLWDVADWGSAAWQDVTPETVDANIQWGVVRAELGILAETEAGTWSIDTFDPDRILDPANPDSPFEGELLPGLPIRLTHRGIVVRTGVVETIGHSMADHSGTIRATDNVAVLAQSLVPIDATPMPNTLRARARAAILFAGIDVTVEPNPPGADPALAPWIPAQESVWDTVSEAARQVLYVPFVDNTGYLRFREYKKPLVRGYVLASPELMDILHITQVAGTFSIVRAKQTVADGGLVIERRLTPLPRYGARVTERKDATPNAAVWCETVLTDRVFQVMRSAGIVRPLDARAVEKWATVETGEFVQIVMLEANPPIASGASVLGGTMHVAARVNSEATWTFEFEVTAAPDEPLVEDGGVFSFLGNELGDVMLFAG